MYGILCMQELISSFDHIVFCFRTLKKDGKDNHKHFITYLDKLTGLRNLLQLLLNDWSKVI
ncbi:hypothetical protein Hanom_Chr16g01472941 [Helianthus anomalus]